jgi:hypothetical protein
MDNVIMIHPQPEVLKEINKSIHLYGVEKVYNHLIERNFHPSFVKCIIRKVLRMRGGK